jgi:AraC family transcriptional regulator, transcriptional activator of pobA
MIPINMKDDIPIWKLRENISGVRIDRIDNAFISSFLDSITRFHRNDHFIAVLLTSGDAEIMVDFKSVQLSNSRLLFSQPGQIQRAVRFNPRSSGWILFLDNKIVDEYARMMIEDSLLKAPLLSLSKTEVDWFTRYFELLSLTYQDQNFGNLHKSAVHSMVVPCICKIASTFHAASDSAAKQKSPRKIELAKRFKRMVRDHYQELKKPSDYADLMSLSINYLNDTVKSVTGFNASHFIQQEMLREAQRLLSYTDLSIKEISSSLGYDDPKYFNRLFTKLCKITPGRFRQDFTSNSVKKVKK